MLESQDPNAAQDAFYLADAQAGPKVYISAASSAPSRSTSSRSGPFYCTEPECEENFTREKDLQRHMCTKHGVSGVFHRCRQCGWDDLRLYNVRKHCRVQHSQPPGQESTEEAFGCPTRDKRPRGPNKF